MTIATTKPRITVVIATYNRHELLRRLLVQLGEQTLTPGDFEVVVIDDGSRCPVQEMEVPYRLTVRRRANGGAAAARHLGATMATGEVVLFLDDDMSAPPALLSEHVRLHQERSRAVVLGRIKRPVGRDMPLFERFHAAVFDDVADGAVSGRQILRGPDVWSGNLSMKRSLYMAVGGFDPSLAVSEDAELGVRLEKHGATFLLSDEAHTVHCSDHASVGAWMRRAHKYGRHDLRISRKHPDVRHANPWRYSSRVSPAAWPLLAAALVAPTPADAVARVVMGVATSLDAIGFERVALVGTELAFGMEYTRGLRHECGGLRATVRDLVRYHRQDRLRGAAEASGA